MLKMGHLAPGFELPDADMEMVKLSSFRDKHGLTVCLLADSGGEACHKYGVWQEKEKDGVKKMSIVRSTFTIDRHGILRDALFGVTPKGHAVEVMNLVKSLE